MTEKTGRLYVVATPIGNLDDITIRAIKTLKEVDFIICEDTRHSKKLLAHFGISKRLISYYKPIELAKAKVIIEELRLGLEGALISDAGTPAISDPGTILVREARANNIEVIPIPGPSSLTAAISISGLKTVPFVFEGFMPKKKKEIINKFQQVKCQPYTWIFYIPARDVNDFLMLANDIIPERNILIARELTKIYEEVKIGKALDLLRLNMERKGEAVIIVEGEGRKNSSGEEDIIELVKNAISDKKSFKDIMKNDKFKHIKRNKLYKIYEELKGANDDRD